jgi:hypothetical protein
MLASNVKVADFVSSCRIFFKKFGNAHRVPNLRACLDAWQIHKDGTIAIAVAMRREGRPPGGGKPTES